MPQIDWLYATLESKVVTVDTHPTATPNSATAPCAVRPNAKVRNGKPNLSNLSKIENTLR